MDEESKSRAKSQRRGAPQRDTSYNLDDFERINSKMENLQNQKEEFMSKINSYAERLRIL